MSYDPNNVFAKILRGEFPCHKVYEDADALVFMDVMPQSQGHALVVPKAAARNIFDADPSVLATVLPLVQKVALPAGRPCSTSTITSSRATKVRACARMPARWKTRRCSRPTPRSCGQYWLKHRKSRRALVTEPSPNCNHAFANPL